MASLQYDLFSAQQREQVAAEGMGRSAVLNDLVACYKQAARQFAYGCRAAELCVRRLELLLQQTTVRLEIETLMLESTEKYARFLLKLQAVRGLKMAETAERVGRKIARAVGVERQRLQEIVQRESKEREGIVTRGVKDRETIARLEIARAQIAERERLPAIARERWWREKLGVAQQREREMLQSRERVERARVESRGIREEVWRTPPPAEHVVHYANVLRGLPDTMGILGQTRSTRQAE